MIELVFWDDSDPPEEVARLPVSAVGGGADRDVHPSLNVLGPAHWNVTIDLARAPNYPRRGLWLSIDARITRVTLEGKS